MRKILFLKFFGPNFSLRKRKIRFHRFRRLLWQTYFLKPDERGVEQRHLKAAKKSSKITSIKTQLSTSHKNNITLGMVTVTEYTKDYVGQLAQSVVTTRVRGGIPTNFIFNSNTNKLLFLASNPTSNLQYVDVTHDKEPSAVEILHPQLLIRETISTEHQLSKEEQLLRERQRLTDTGITSYFPTPDGEKIMIPAGNHIHVAQRRDTHFVIESSYPSNGAMDLKWSPDGQVISFVRNDGILFTPPLFFLLYFTISPFLVVEICAMLVSDY